MSDTVSAVPDVTTISGYYTTILNRPGSSAEWTGWANLVNDVALTLIQVQSDIANSFEALTNVAPIVEMYQADLGRVPDQAGLLYWVTAEDTGALTLAQISADIANSAESRAYYGVTNGLASATSVALMYTTILGRQPESGAVASWMNTGMSEAAIQQAIAASPEAMARTTPAVIAFLNAVAQGNNPSAYTGSLSVAPNSNAGGTTFTLTPGAAVFGVLPANQNRTPVSAVRMECAMMWPEVGAPMQAAA
jgi:hypothetical protein